MIGFKESPFMDLFGGEYNNISSNLGTWCAKSSTVRYSKQYNEENSHPKVSNSFMSRKRLPNINHSMFDSISPMIFIEIAKVGLKLETRWLSNYLFITSRQRKLKIQCINLLLLFNLQ
ncbi:hypothetical protein LOD99_15211 [Oopsacas minuta]|uniref:Uncharacterized protein n=1 Tax=Oopsacas minuta TaxID=111878 RepID=A0AAV7KB82_9METZ|nr:hypothetical protein LOD99_15211 [Oopsacas minuta]